MPDAPRAAHVVISLACGGLERLVVDWTNARNRMHPDSTLVCCLDEPGELAPQVEGAAVVTIGARRGRFPWDRAAVQRLRETLNGHPGGPFHLLHSHNLAAQQYAVLAARGTPMRHVHTQHGANLHLQRPLDRMRSRLLRRFTDCLVAVSEATAEAMRRSQGVRRSRLEVIPNGVALPREAPPAPEQRAAARRECGLPDDAFVLGSVGRMARVKGYDRLVRAFAAATRGTGGGALGRARLLLIGDGPERAAIGRLIRDLGMESRVVLAGFRADAPRLLAAMDAFVLPSRSEGMPIGLLEAMAAGVPALASDAGSSRELIDDGRAGIVLPADEARWPDQLAAAAADPGRLQALARAARRRVEEHYALERGLARYEAIYRELAG
jgi:glycosyltransferase involved in cell wall biosynthesis